jgi:hypothetical protein
VTQLAATGLPSVAGALLIWVVTGLSDRIAVLPRHPQSLTGNAVGAERSQRHGGFAGPTRVPGRISRGLIYHVGMPTT